MCSALGSIIWTLLIGIIVGALARLLLPGKDAFPPGAWGLASYGGPRDRRASSERSLAEPCGGGENYAAGWIMDHRRDRGSAARQARDGKPHNNLVCRNSIFINPSN